MAFVLRTTKGSRLTHAELDANFSQLAASSGSSLVGFLQSGAGAVARTVQAKERDIVSVTDFGQNGVRVSLTQTLEQAAVNQAGIQAAIDSGADTIFFPTGGDWWHTDQFLLYNLSNVYIEGGGGATNLVWVSVTDTAKAHIKIQQSSYCKIRKLWMNRQDSTHEPGFGVYITSEGNNPITQFNEVDECFISNCAIAGVQIGHATVNADVNVDCNKVRNTIINFCGRVATPGGGVRIHGTNTNMTVVEGGAIASCIPDNVVVALGARGQTFDNIIFTPDSGTDSVHIHIKNSISGPITIKNMVCELFDEQFLVVDPTSGGVYTYPLMTLESLNFTNNATVPGIKIIDHQGTGGVTMRNVRCGGGTSTSGGAGGVLSFQPPNVASSGNMLLITEGVHLYDGAAFDVQTDHNRSAFWRWLDIGTTSGGSAAGDVFTNTQVMRLNGGIGLEAKLLTPLNLPTGVTLNNLGHLGRQTWKVTIAKEAWTAAALTQDIAIATFPAKTRLVGAYCDTTVAFAGLAGTISLMISGTGADGSIIADHDVKTAAVTKGLLDADMGTGLTRAARIQDALLLSWTSGSSQPQVRLTSGTGNIGTGAATNLSAGSVTIYLITETMP